MTKKTLTQAFGASATVTAGGIYTITGNQVAASMLSPYTPQKLYWGLLNSGNSIFSQSNWENTNFDESLVVRSEGRTLEQHPTSLIWYERIDFSASFYIANTAVTAVNLV